ncbi:MAG: DNA sulfur modification protein DndB [Burkholderiales bacterium]|jgi:DNA sulfur modification protein DndB|nr:DNA sulfur modification protein DndB [Rhodocyclaceae bacterium]MCA3057985.1 DNA sulfur modification protein DndB [Rhodocyclaceae bacterium]MCA3167520.1 DNA sulfur modification protein DndB [Burkholderiales bacterium]MCE2724617.1 DNA sulfur modification protein DndB [Betaproteobacteria bacterium]
MFVHVPAMRGKIGARTYYACLMPMSAIPNLFKFTDWAGFTPEDREQRVLNEKRVPELRDYINDNEDDYLFSSITASYKSQPTFDPVPNGAGLDGSLGILKLKLGDELIINDGQHRCAGIVEALKQNPAIGDHTISVLLFPWESKDRVQQMFSDLNRFVTKTSKSLDILYDKRDVISAATLASLEQVPVFKDLTDKDAISLKAKSAKLFTLAALYDANRELLKGREDDEILSNVKILTEYWKVVAQNMPDWVAVQAHHKEAGELRAEKIASHSTVLRALGGLGQELMKDDTWQERLTGLQNIDWSKKNKDWENVCIVANSVVSNRQARAATKAYVKGKLGMPLTDAEQRSMGRVANAATLEDL